MTTIHVAAVEGDLPTIRIEIARAPEPAREEGEEEGLLITAGEEEGVEVDLSLAEGDMVAEVEETEEATTTDTLVAVVEGGFMMEIVK